MRELNVAGVVVVLMMILFVWNKKERLLLSDYLVIAININAGLYLLTDPYVWDYEMPLLYMLNIGTYFIGWPVSYIYAAKLLQKRQQWFARDWRLFALAIGIMSYMGLGYFLFDFVSLAQLKMPYIELFWQLFYAVNVVLFAVLLSRQRLEIQAVEQSFAARTTQTDQYGLPWIKSVNAVLLVMLVAFFAIYCGFATGLIETDANASYLTAPVLVAAVSILTFKGINIYVLADLPESNQELSKNSLPKYQSSTLTETEELELFEKLVTFFKQDQLYLNPQLTIQSVAELLEVKVHYLSQAINARTGNSFYDFVNAYRVEQLKRLLSEPEQQAYTILALAYESGFNSKASLNRIFKNHTGKTPSAYRKAHQQTQLPD